MSELKFKAYGELEISEALSDASHVIIEENGDVKRFPANSIGKVKTVNGAEPDENGNVAVEIPAPVQPDLSQNDPEAPDYVKNRPFYQDTVFDITWDGNTEGLDAVEGMPFYKVSGTAPEKNDISGSEIVFENDGVQEVHKADDIGYMEGENCIAIGEFVVITYAENATMAGIIFPTIGVWFISFGTQFTRSLKKTITKTLDADYLPDTVATKSEVEAVQTIANNAQTTAENAQTIANNAQTTAENAKTIAENAVGADVVKGGNYKLRIGQGKYAGYGFAILHNDSVQMNYTNDGIYDERTGSNLNMSSQSVFKESKSSQKKIVITTNADGNTQENSIVLDGSNGQYLSISADGRLYYSGKALTVGSSPNFCKIIRGVNTPELEYDAATKGYVDGKISDTEIFLKSSTADSAKKFKITVDDSGNLTATEVTE